MYLLKLKFASENEWVAAQEHMKTPALDIPESIVPADQRPTRRMLPGVQIVVLGTLYRDTGNTITITGPGGQPMQVPERVASDGWHVDAIVPDNMDLTALHSALVNPVQPKHVWAGNLVLAMPETLPEAEDVAMVTRGIGQQVPDDVLARLELAVLRGRLTPEMAADRRAWIEAGIAITEARAALSQARQDRERAVEDARKADAERDRLLALRQAEVDKRAAAVAAMAGLTGAARQAEAAKRDAATATAADLADRIAAQVSALAIAVQARDDAAAVLEAERVRIAAARVARDGLKAALK